MQEKSYIQTYMHAYNAIYTLHNTCIKYINHNARWGSSAPNIDTYLSTLYVGISCILCNMSI